MIDKPTAKRQVMRLSQLISFPRDSESALGDLVSAIQGAATQEAAERCVSAFLDTADENTRCPLAPQLRGWLNERAPKPFGCAECNFTGFKIVEIGGFSGAKPCECRLAHQGSPA